MAVLYEIELRYGGGREVRPYAGPLTEGERIALGGSLWHVLRAVRPLSAPRGRATSACRCERRRAPREEMLPSQ